MTTTFLPPTKTAQRPPSRSRPVSHPPAEETPAPDVPPPTAPPPVNMRGWRGLTLRVVQVAQVLHDAGEQADATALKIQRTTRGAHTLQLVLSDNASAYTEFLDSSLVGGYLAEYLDKVNQLADPSTNPMDKVYLLQGLRSIETIVKSFGGSNGLWKINFQQLRSMSQSERQALIDYYNRGGV